MFSINFKPIAALCALVLVSACFSPVVISLPEKPKEPGPVLAATQPFPAEVTAALPAEIPASAVKIQDGCYFYRYGDDIKPVSFDGTNPICPAA